MHIDSEKTSALPQKKLPAGRRCQWRPFAQQGNGLLSLLMPIHLAKTSALPQKFFARIHSWSKPFLGFKLALISTKCPTTWKKWSPSLKKYFGLEKFTYPDPAFAAPTVKGPGLGQKQSVRRNVTLLQQAALSEWHLTGDVQCRQITLLFRFRNELLA